MTQCQESVALGAYVLGALDPEERTALERHIRTCAHCREELLHLAPLPGLLRHTPFEELPDTAEQAESLTPARPVAPASATAPTTAAAGAHVVTGPGRRPLRRRALLAAALAGAAAVTGVVVYSVGARQEGNAPPAAAGVWSATDASTHVSATARLTPEAWGTDVRLTLGNLPAGITCRLVVHSREGVTETAGTWGSGYSSSATVPASTSVSPSDISGMEILDNSGRVLVHLPATS
jgi:hypothetical protein